MKPKRKQDRAFLDYIKTLPCLECNSRVGVDPAHIKTVGAGGGDDYWNVIPLCRRHHQEQHRIGILSFMDKHPRVWKFLVSQGWERDFRGKLFHPGNS